MSRDITHRAPGSVWFHHLVDSMSHDIVDTYSGGEEGELLRHLTLDPTRDYQRLGVGP